MYLCKLFLKRLSPSLSLHSTGVGGGKGMEKPKDTDKIPRIGIRKLVIYPIKPHPR